MRRPSINVKALEPRFVDKLNPLTFCDLSFNPESDEAMRPSFCSLNRTEFLGDLIAWEDGVYGTSKSVFSGGA